jgi:hypothetical protein
LSKKRESGYRFSYVTPKIRMTDDFIKDCKKIIALRQKQ